MAQGAGSQRADRQVARLAFRKAWNELGEIAGPKVNVQLVVQDFFPAEGYRAG